MHIHLYLKCRLFMSNLLQIRTCSHISVEIQTRNFIKVKPMGAAFSMQVKEGRKGGLTDRHMMTATDTFCI